MNLRPTLLCSDVGPLPACTMSSPSGHPARRAWWTLPLALVLALQSRLWLYLRPLAQLVLQWPVWQKWGTLLVRWLQRRSPWQAVACMLMPIALANLLKLICVYWTVQGRWFVGAALYVTLKTLEFGCVALIEQACRPTLRTVKLYRVVYLLIARIRRWTNCQLRPWRRWWSAVRADFFSKPN